MTPLDRAIVRHEKAKLEYWRHPYSRECEKEFHLSRVFLANAQKSLEKVGQLGLPFGD